MEVILLEKVDNLGNLGDLVNVKPGYGRNYLIPKGKAASATPENRAKFETRRAELEHAATDLLASAEARRTALEALEVSITRMAGEEGKLFGSVGTADIAEAFTQQGVELKKQEVRLPEGVFRQTGEYLVDVHLHPEVNIQVKVVIAAE